MVSKSSLSELLHDESEIKDLLDAYGDTDFLQKGKYLRERLLKHLENVGETRLLTALFEFAKGFALMANEIFAFCESKEIGIGGQIQVMADQIFLEKTALNTGWAFEGGASWNVALEQRANALASAIDDLAERLKPEKFKQDGMEKRETELGRSWRTSGDIRSQTLINLATKNVHFEGISDMDYQVLSTIISTLETGEAELARAPLPPGILTAIDRLQERGNALRSNLEGLPRLHKTDEPNPLVNSLADEISLLIQQSRRLAEEAAVGERVENGFQDFLKTEFWFQRWRIYELFLLVRILSVLESIGGTVHLENVEASVWKLHYGRASEPVATCDFPKGKLEVYYQLIQESEEGHDMPDIAVFARGGRAVFVLDPKHGYSYDRSKVQPVLCRYARNLDADMTAIVNYFPIRSYLFDAAITNKRKWLLASDIAPFTANLRRLEIGFTDVLLGRGYGRFSRPVSESKAEQKTRVPPQAATLIYWAGEAREVDEPSGFWMLSENGGQRPLPALTEYVESAPAFLAASATGEACVLGVKRKVILLSRNHKPKTISDLDDFRDVSWNSQGTLFYLKGSNNIVIFDQQGERKASLDQCGTLLGWDEEEGALLSYQMDYSDHPHRVTLLRSIDLETWTDIWKEIISDERWRHLSLRDNATTIILSPDRGMLINLSSSLIIKSGQVELASSEEDWAIISASRQGQYLIRKGPPSLRRVEGVSLLAIQDTTEREDAAPPLVRFYGEIAGSICWSPDATRFAFLARRPKTRLENRLLSVRVGDRYALTVSAPGQAPSKFAWLSPALLKTYLD